MLDSIHDVHLVKVSDPKDVRHRGKNKKDIAMGNITHDGYYVMGDITHVVKIALWKCRNEVFPFVYIFGPFDTFCAAKRKIREEIEAKIVSQKAALMKIVTQRKKDVLVYKKGAG